MFMIRPPQRGDASGIDGVHRQAFPTDAEARLVGLLLVRGQDRVSLVAEMEGQVVGLCSSARRRSSGANDRP